MDCGNCTTAGGRATGGSSDDSPGARASRARACGAPSVLRTRGTAPAGARRGPGRRPRTPCGPRRPCAASSLGERLQPLLERRVVGLAPACSMRRRSATMRRRSCCPRRRASCSALKRVRKRPYCSSRDLQLLLRLHQRVGVEHPLDLAGRHDRRLPPLLTGPAAAAAARCAPSVTAPAAATAATRRRACGAVSASSDAASSKASQCQRSRAGTSPVPPSAAARARGARPATARRSPCRRARGPSSARLPRRRPSRTRPPDSATRPSEGSSGRTSGSATAAGAAAASIAGGAASAASRRRRATRASSRRPAPPRATAPSASGSARPHGQPANHDGPARRAFGGDRVAHARGEMIPEQRRRFRHVDVRPPPTSSRAARRADAGTRRRPAGAARTPRPARLRRDRRTPPACRCTHHARLAAEPLLQIAQRVKEVRLHRADRAAEHVGDLLVRHLVIHAQDERGPLLRAAARAIAARTRAARSSRSSRSDADSARVSTCCRSSIGSVGGVFALTRLRQTFTPIRYSHVASDDWPRKFRSPRYARRNTSCDRSLASSWLPTKR